MNRKSILAALAIAAAAGGIALLPGEDTTEAETAVADGVEPAEDLTVVKRWEPTITASPDGVRFSRALALIAVDEAGKEVGRLPSDTEPDVTVYSPCYIVESIARCETERGSGCIARDAWGPHIDLLVAAGGSLPSLTDCTD